VNPKVTIPKREAIREVSYKLAGIISQIKWMDDILLADLTAGDCCEDANSTGRLFVELGEWLRRKGKRVCVVLNDNEERFIAPLKSISRGHLIPRDEYSFADGTFVMNEDYGDAVLSLARAGAPGGIVLIDPFGCVERLDLIASAMDRLKRVDVLVSISAAGCKRAAAAHGMTTRTSDIRQSLPKPHWHVMEPWSKHQWTLMLGTRASSISRMPKIKFFPVSSEEGKHICKVIDRTAKEISDEESVGLVYQCEFDQMYGELF
tara:strand:+ start:352 stop:1137 length:786 start_codon:yes stop_codon:yes gene_type:complete